MSLLLYKQHNSTRVAIHSKIPISVIGHGIMVGKIASWMLQSGKLLITDVRFNLLLSRIFEPWIDSEDPPFQIAGDK
jgi:hypothetical protein